MAIFGEFVYVYTTRKILLTQAISYKVLNHCHSYLEEKKRKMISYQFIEIS